MGVQGLERQPPFTSEPEGIGGAAGDDLRSSSKAVWARRVRRRLSARFRWNHVLVAVVVLVVVAVSLFARFPARLHKKKENAPATMQFLLVDSSAHSQGPEESGPGSSFKPSYCQGQQQHRYHDQIMALSFERLRNLTFQEVTYGHASPSSVDVGGQIIVRGLKKGGGDPRLVLEIAANEPGLQLFASVDADGQEVKIQIPGRYGRTVAGQTPCVEVMGTIWVPEGAELHSLLLDVAHLDVLVFDDLSLRVTNGAKIKTTAGDVKSGARTANSYRPDTKYSLANTDETPEPARHPSAFDSRIIEVYTTSGGIDGDWPLYDVLGLHAMFGDLRVTIAPKDELQSDPKPASLSLSTISGSITATQPIREARRIPRREYVVDVKSTAGRIGVALAVGADTKVRTTSGDLTLDLLPVMNIDKLTPRSPAKLETATRSGAIAVEVLEPLFFDENGRTVSVTDEDDDDVVLASMVLDCLEAKHKSTSGSIKLVYPQSWEGLLYAKTTSGKLVAEGKDLTIIRYVGGWPGSILDARKGLAGVKSTILATTIVGTVNALIGDKE